MAATTYIVVATISDKRWFDLDAERTELLPHSAKYEGGSAMRAGVPRGAQGLQSNPAGAPPLDCWIDGDPWTQTPPPEGDPVSRCVMHIGDAFTHMAKLEDNSVDLIVTSPPFLALRSYLPADHPDKGKEIGSEATPAAFLSTLLALTREWRRILAPHGSIAVELGDTYSGSGGGGGDYLEGGLREGQPGFGGSAERQREGNAAHWRAKNVQKDGWPLAKSLCLLPSLYAGSLAYGHNLLNPDDQIAPWRIRNLIVWHRPNPPVGALGDKVRPSTSYITTACVDGDVWTALDNPNGPPPLDAWFENDLDGDVWTIPTQPYKGAHYATYPIALPRRLINLMCPREVCVVCGEPRRRIVERPPEYLEHAANAKAARLAAGVSTGWTQPDGAKRVCALPDQNYRGATTTTLGWTDCEHNNYRRGVVLDPFAGSGTTLAAAAESGRDAIGIDLDERNLWLIRERVGLFLEEVS